MGWILMSDAVPLPLQIAFLYSWPRGGLAIGPEARIQRNISVLMKTFGFAVWDMSQDRATRQTPGVPDLIIMGWGRVLFVEVKTPKGKESPTQIDFRETCNANGGLSLVWRCDSDAMDWCHQQGIVKMHQEIVQ